MFVKFKDEKHIEYFPGWVQEDGIIYTNHIAVKKARDHGWKELITEEIPSYNSETQYIDYKYIEEELTIRKVWTINNYSDHIDEI